ETVARPPLTTSHCSGRVPEARGGGGSMARGHGAWIWSALAIAVAITAAARRAEAQSPTVEAEAMFRQGKDLMASGKIADACAAFDLSQKLDPRATTLINQANCRERNG